MERRPKPPSPKGSGDDLAAAKAAVAYVDFARALGVPDERIEEHLYAALSRPPK